MDVDDAQLNLFSLSDKAQKTSGKAIPCTVVQVKHFFTCIVWPKRKQHNLIEPHAFQMLDELGNQIDDIEEISTLQIYFTVIQIKEYDDLFLITQFYLLILAETFRGNKFHILL